MAFQQKCLDRIAGFKERGCAILLVSHDIGLIRRLCDEALWLEKGKVVEHGPAHMVADHYSEAMLRERRPVGDQVGRVTLPNGQELRPNENRFGTFEVQIEAVHLKNGAGEAASVLCSGDGLRVELEYSAPEAVKAPIFGVSLSQEDGTVIYDTSTAGNLDAFLPILSGRGKAVLHLERLDLGEGTYYVDVGIYQKDWEYAYDYHWHVYPLEIDSTSNEKGVLRPPHRWEFYSDR
jgi:lipopolysaccharide transport system ATP-binding protein